MYSVDYKWKEEILEREKSTRSKSKRVQSIDVISGELGKNRKPYEYKEEETRGASADCGEKTSVRTNILALTMHLLILCKIEMQRR